MKNNRRSFILELVKRNEIEKQEELVSLLCDNGFNVTQATVSRDINLLGLKKAINHNKKSVYVATTTAERSEKERFEVLFREVVISIKCSNNIVVIRTREGSANSACALIDRLCLKEIMGTVAGDDTIIMVIDSNDDALRVVARFEEILK